MEKITSFSINHDILNPGIYLSRSDRNTYTLDLRLTRPNIEFISAGALHTIEHLAATYLRNSKIKNSVVYFGPMGCQTGCYLVLFDDVSYEDAIEAVKAAFKFTAEFKGEIPGSKRDECGNYRLHDLEDAKLVAKKYVFAINTITPQDLTYPN